MSFLRLCEAKLGNTTEARRLATEAANLAPKDAVHSIRRCDGACTNGGVEQAFAFLQMVIRGGYSRSEASVDQDLTSLDGLAEFQNLVTGTQ